MKIKFDSVIPSLKDFDFIDAESLHVRQRNAVDEDGMELILSFSLSIQSDLDDPQTNALFSCYQAINLISRTKLRISTLCWNSKTFLSLGLQLSNIW